MIVKKILAATDFSNSAEVALKTAIELSQQYKSELIVLHVVEPAPTYPSIFELWSATPFLDSQAQMNNYLLEETQKRLTLLCEKLRDKNVDCRFYIEQGQPHSEIIKVAQNETVDLLVMGNTGHGYLQHALFGQVVDRVVRKARCMTLVVPIETMMKNNP